jgi:hypothetical protein
LENLLGKVQPNDGHSFHETLPLDDVNRITHLRLCNSRQIYHIDEISFRALARTVLKVLQAQAEQL